MFRSHPMMSFLKNTQIWAKSGFAPKNLKNAPIVMNFLQKLYFNVFYRLKKSDYNFSHNWAIFLCSLVFPIVLYCLKLNRL